MPQITTAESKRQIEELQQAVDVATAAGRWGDAVTALRALLDHPCAHHLVGEDEVWDELYQVLRRERRYDDAIDAKRRAIAAGYRSMPDPEADIAEMLVEAGRRDEADELYAELRERDPDDVWLYNSAGYIYAGVDDREALRWCLDGIEVALATGDPDQVVVQLLQMAEGRWTALGEPVDDALVARVDDFVASWKPGGTSRRWPDMPARAHRFCDHCGADPASSIGTELHSLPSPSGRPPAVALAWFPASEWAGAHARWPDELGELPADHVEYSHRIESRVKRTAQELRGGVLAVAPLAVAELEERFGEEAGTGAARAHLAAELLRQGRAIPWPPGRNDRCWCGSGRKYKQCCGPVPPAPLT
jgi:tetratricopeptide (TPR) repeat protein